MSWLKFLRVRPKKNQYGVVRNISDFAKGRLNPYSVQWWSPYHQKMSIEDIEKVSEFKVISLHTEYDSASQERDAMNELAGVFES